MVWKCPPLHLPNWNNLWKWKEEMNTCDKCKHWSTDAESWKGSQFEKQYAEQGECSLFGDSNTFSGVPPRNDVCYGWDYEGYSAGVTVMAKFGCIHWENKNG